MVKISVIVPVYNAAEFLTEALDSVLSQTLRDIEIIVVNDGSTDNSNDILDVYKRKDLRLSVLQQDNKGPSEARNKGLLQAQGEYVFFFDSDDILDKKALASLYECAVYSHADLVIGKYDIYNGSSYRSVNNLDRLVKKETIDRFDKDILWTFSLWNKLFKRSVIEENRLSFEPVSYSEDGIFTMKFVFYANKITGCNKIINHYRRMPCAIYSSITSSVSEWKIRDYLTAHKLIYLFLKEEILNEYPQYIDFNSLLCNEDKMCQYVNEFLKKEINVLVNQFYRKFWTIDEKMVECLAVVISNLLKKINLDTYYQLAADMQDLHLDNLYSNYVEALADCRVSVALYGTSERADAFLKTLRSLASQTLVGMNIYIPLNMYTQVINAQLMHKNMVCVDCDSLALFYQKSLAQTKAQGILFTNDCFSYESGALRRMYLNMKNSYAEVCDNFIYLNIGNKAAACSWHSKAFCVNHRNERYIKRNLLLANKLIDTCFLKKVNLSLRGSNTELAEEITKKAIYIIEDSVNVIFEESHSDADFIQYLTSINANYFQGMKHNHNVCSLADCRLERDMVEVYSKLMPSNKKKKYFLNKRDIIEMINKLPVQDKVLFYSTHADGRMGENLAALYKLVEGKKIVATHPLPHSQQWKLCMYYHFATSKIILLDDNADYLRLFPLKKEQRVIQMWHRCGIFEKFGIYNITSTEKLERASHIQYNLVPVSSESVKHVYAGSFGIDIEKVSALGVPATDKYFKSDYIDKIIATILKKYPQFASKYIVLYVPESEFVQSEMKFDFTDLSLKLPPNMLLIIASEKSSKALQDKFENIIEINDFSVEDLMFVSNLLVTDYSSIIFEYALLGKPMVFFCSDREIYSHNFYLDNWKDLPGEVFDNYDKFINYLMNIDRHVLTEKYYNFIDKYMNACDGHSAERIAEMINSYMRG